MLAQKNGRVLCTLSGQNKTIIVKEKINDEAC
jgi:hypothetical protein